MSTFPNFSNIAPYVQSTLNDRVNNPYEVSKLNPWIRVVSGVSNTAARGLVLYSNPDFTLFKAAGDNAPASIYGTTSQAGALGVDWDNKAIVPKPGIGLRPSPIIESIEIDEGAGNLSRKANFSIKCFSKEQMELVTQYFLEPGFSIFIEFGWNTAAGVRYVTTDLSAESVGNFQNFKNVDTKRKNSEGQYDNYLGFITGGNVEVSGEIWTVNVKCTGFTELPAYLINGDNGGKKQSTDEDTQELIEKTAKENEYGNLSSEADLNKKRWMFAYNALPSNRKTIPIKGLETKKDDSLQWIPMAHAVNYINFDEPVRDKMNNRADGTMWSRFWGYGGAKQSTEASEEKRLDLPAGTEIIGSERFIRFGALMKIFNATIADSYKIGDEDVKLAIDSSNCICGAYPSIFSTRKDKLFIPNPQTPKFDFISAQTQTEPITKIPKEKPVDSSVEYDNVVVKFPNQSKIEDGIIKDLGLNVCYADGYTTNGMGIYKDPNEWGFLDDLYVNFEFASEILSTSNLNVKDALYQILNGMSSAVNDLWNFQILPKTAPVNNRFGVNDGGIILCIVDMNFNYKDKGDPPYEFNLIGTHSIFKNASFNLEMSGAKMNQVIGNRLGNQMGTETQPYIGRLFSKGNTDLVLQQIRTNEEANSSNGGEGKDPTAEEIEELKEKNYLNFLGKLGNYPKVNLEKDDITKEFDINENSYVAIYDDAQLLKIAKDESSSELSPLLPIRVSFTINGVSGIKRGDKFKVKGIPDMYYKRGFFQVTSVKHTLSGMQWDTEIEGGFRNDTSVK